MQYNSRLPETGFVRLARMIAPHGPIPLRKSTVYAHAKAGKYPKPFACRPACRHGAGRTCAHTSTATTTAGPKMSDEAILERRTQRRQSNNGGRRCPTVTWVERYLRNSRESLRPMASCAPQPLAPIRSLNSPI